MQMPLNPHIYYHNYITQDRVLYYHHLKGCITSLSQFRDKGSFFNYKSEEYYGTTFHFRFELSRSSFFTRRGMEGEQGRFLLPCLRYYLTSS